MVSMTGTNLLGVGLFTPAEAALYARVSTATIVRWVHGNRMGQSVIQAGLANDPERTITFLDFVQALAIRAIRRDFRLSLQKIRDAVDHARRRYDVEHPFAMRHRTFLFDEEIWIELNRLPLVQVSGKQKGQRLMREIAEPFMQDLTYSDDDLAIRFRAFEHGGRYITIDPSRRFGQPIVDNTGYTVFSLLEAYRTEGAVAAAAAACGVDEADVNLAIRYDDFLRGPLAA